jgi:hypothetical protein
MAEVNLTKASSIMLFYAILACVIGPVIGYKITHTKEGLGNGFVAGSILSILLWYVYGKKQV